MTSQSDPLSGLEGGFGGGTSFGVNAAEVWTFLGELPELDLDRAIRVWEGYRMAEPGRRPLGRLHQRHHGQQRRAVTLPPWISPRR